jgi:hypothetical protein
MHETSPDLSRPLEGEATPNPPWEGAGQHPPTIRTTLAGRATGAALHELPRLVNLVGRAAGAVWRGLPRFVRLVRRRLPGSVDLLLFLLVVLVLVVYSRRSGPGPASTDETAPTSTVTETPQASIASAPEESGTEEGREPNTGTGPEESVMEEAPPPSTAPDASAIDEFPPPAEGLSPVRTPQAMLAVTPESVEGPIGSAIELAVRMSGRQDRPVVDGVVLWRVQGGAGGMLEDQIVRTDPRGVARTTLRLPSASGRIVVIASAYVVDLPAVRFEVTVRPRSR